MELICPLCGETLENTEKSFRCPNRHSFDIARQGYVHLLPVQSKHSGGGGGAREQVISRRRFLEGWRGPSLDRPQERERVQLPGGRGCRTGPAGL